MAARQGFALDIGCHFLPFVQRLEAFVHNAFLPPQHQQGELEQMALLQIEAIVRQVDAR